MQPYEKIWTKQNTLVTCLFCCNFDNVFNVHATANVGPSVVTCLEDESNNAVSVNTNAHIDSFCSWKLEVILIEYSEIKVNDKL